MESKVLKPNIYILLGTITLGALGALTINRLRRIKREDQVEVPPIQYFSRQSSFNPHIHDLDIFSVQKTEFQRLKLQNIKDNDLASELKHMEEITSEVERVSNLVYDLKLTSLQLNVNPMLGNSQYRSVFGGEGFLPESAFVSSDCFILQRSEYGPNDLLSKTKRWLRAGPRKHLLFNQDEVKAAIMIGGGLCPGINAVVRELVMVLSSCYRVTSIQGIKYGFSGIQKEWLQMTPQSVQFIHHSGGSFLGCTRARFDVDLVLDELVMRGINQFYVVAGMGTMKCLHELCLRIKERSLRIAVVAIPKSQDNDIPIIDSSFGFESGVEAAQSSIEAAYSETHSREHCIGIIRVNGRHAGFMAMHASSASRSTNVCLVPEFQFDLFGQRGLLNYVLERVKLKGSCLIVTSIGAVQSIRDINQVDKGCDGSGNEILVDIGILLKDEIRKYANKQNRSIEVKYLDPLHLIRASQANSLDTKMCSQLAQNAVHGIMAGFTMFAVGHVSNKTCYIPLDEMLSGNYSNRIQSNNINWQRLLASTGQPSFLNDEQAVCPL